MSGGEPRPSVLGKAFLLPYSATTTPADKFIYTSRRQRLACIGPLEWLGHGIRISRQVYYFLHCVAVTAPLEGRGAFCRVPLEVLVRVRHEVA
jgi:hypothetical protein